MAWNFALIVNEMTECQPYEIALVGVHVLCVFELFLCVFDGVTKYGTWYKLRGLVGGSPHE